MLPPIFYIPPGHGTGRELVLPPSEARHAVAVLRLSDGDEIIGVDGQGCAYRGSLRRAGRSGANLIVSERIEGFGEPHCRVTVAAGLSQAGKFDEIVERCTELGVHALVPLLTEKSRIKQSGSRWADRKVERLRQVSVAAMKQCRRSRLPAISTPVTISEYLLHGKRSDICLLFTPDGPAITIDQAILPASVESAVLLVGPEAGFSSSEVELAQKAGYKAVHLGTRILRAETAAPTALALVIARLGGFSR